MKAGLVGVAVLGLLAPACCSVLVVNVVASRESRTFDEPQRILLGPSHAVVFTHKHGTGRELVQWQRVPRPQIADPERSLPEASPPGWSWIGAVPPDQLGEVPEFGTQLALGWPALCAVGEVQRYMSWGVMSPGPTHVFVFRGLELPYRPLWRGLAVNLVVHGVAWWGLVAIIRHLRRRIVRYRRWDRGLCMNCGYDVYEQPGESVCPECGEPRR